LSFDEADGAAVKAEAHGEVADVVDFGLEGVAGNELTTARTAGHRANALRFDGNLFAKAAFPGLSGATTHTIELGRKSRRRAPATLKSIVCSRAGETGKRRLRKRFPSKRNAFARGRRCARW